MSTLISLSLLIFASYVSSTPLSTNPLGVPRQRSPLAKAPILDTHHPHGTINDSYIIALKPGLSAAVRSNHLNFLQAAHSSDPLILEDGLHSGIKHVYPHSDGYSGSFTRGVLDQIRSMPEVDYVERDQIVRTVDIQKSAPWVSDEINYLFCTRRIERIVSGPGSCQPSRQAQFQHVFKIRIRRGWWRWRGCVCY
jgi:cerevisin